MPYVRNRDALLGHGDAALRRAALEVIERALGAADPYPALTALVRRDGESLRIGGIELGIEGRRVLFLGAGKASVRIAQGVEEVLGERLAGGIVVCKYGEERALSRIRVRLAGHPVPDQAGLAAAEEVAALARATRPGDLVIAGISGGSSALLPLPAEGVSLADKQETTRLLLGSGAGIVEINAVRKHLSRIKGGRLALMLHPEAWLVNLTVSDVIGDPLDYITDPTVPDTSTLADARATLDRHDLWGRVPRSVADHLRGDEPERETPKAFPGRRVRTFLLVGSAAACEAAADAAHALGFAPMILSTRLEGESREVGRTFAAIAGEVLAAGRPLRAPCAVIGGGETTVRLDSWSGEGGPNQEFALGAALALSGAGRAAVAGLDTDGSDGPTGLAGGLVDHLSAARAGGLGIDLRAALARHDASAALRALDDAIVTGATGTNVNDLKLMLVAPPG